VIPSTDPFLDNRKTMENKRMIIGITQGDINGIGYEVILKTLLENHLYEFCTPVLYGSPKVAAYYRKTLNLEQLSLTSIAHIEEATAKKPYIINCISDDVKVDLGKSTEMAGTASFQSLDAAVRDLAAGKLDAIVTAPINKKNIQSLEFTFPGHTEYLEQVFNEGKKALMLMVSDVLRIAVVTGHIPVSQVASTLTSSLIEEKIRLLNRSLKEDFGVVRPRIAVLGLNPHAGDEGLIGNEEETLIRPALDACTEEGIICVGPFAADGFFGAGTFKSYDAVLAMYHDQGLIPFKTLAMEEGVNFTAGLPVIRTSPGHGTAYHIAGQNIASESSFRHALFLAYDVFKNRQEYHLINQNPLRNIHNERSGGIE
jgi:4-hydroxythreonine-4-phosphate dehydrogenase